MASIPVTWSWGETRTITGFDPAADLFELDWFNGADLDLTEEDGKIIRASWSRADAESPTPLLEDAARQLRDYFDGKRTDFDLPLHPKGSEFQKAVWRQMLKIPYGGTKTYGELAKAIDGTARSVGTACGANPIPVIIPCHRVVGADGTMTGFSGGDGVETKQALLRLEGALLL